MNKVVKEMLFCVLLSTLIHYAACVLNDMLDRNSKLVRFSVLP